MKAISVVNVMGNKIGQEQRAKLQEIMRSRPNLISLCGIAGDATEADLSGLDMDADDAIILASELPDKRALLVLSMNRNHLRVDGGKALAEGLKGNNVITELNIADNNLTDYGLDMSGIIILADVIKDMGAMTALNLASNELGAKGAKIVAEAIKVSMCALLMSI
jgi:Ran GTPase-activating protein (RanGAP) involved in mRNA processing and transport